MVRHLIFIILFAAAIFAVQYGMSHYRKNSAINNTYAEITEHAQQSSLSLGEPEIIAMEKVARKKIEGLISSNGSNKGKLSVAANSFLGFYLVGRQRAKYCQNQGVDITPLTTAFNDSHKNEYALAVEAIAASPSDIDKLYKTIKPQLAAFVAQDMEFIASEYGVSVAEACKVLSDNAAIIVPDMHISKRQPLVYNLLVSDN